MNPPHLSSPRPIIEDAVERLFQCPVKPTDRVCQILEQTAHYRGDDQTYVLLSAILRRVPAVTPILTELGVDVRQLLLPFSTGAEMDRLGEHVVRVLGQAFLENFFDSSSFNDSARVVRTVKHLRVDDLIAAPLHSPYNWPDNIPQTMLTSLLYASGLDPDPLTSAEIEQHAIRIRHGLRDVQRVDPSSDSQQFILSWDGKKYSIRPFGAWGAFQFDSQSLPDSSLWIARGNVLEKSSIFSDYVLAELEDLINSGAKEQEFQKFFEHYPEFLLALGDYSAIHPQLVLHEETGTRLIPDFFLEKLNSDFCDICDLKRATVELVRNQKNRARFRDAVMEGIGQLEHYRDWFEDRSHRTEFRDRYGLNAYRPKIVLIVGRRQSYFDDVQRIRLESGLPNWVRLSTYDDVANNARKWRTLVSGDGDGRA